MSIEIKLANGKTAVLDTGEEAANFIQTYGGKTPIVKNGQKPRQYAGPPQREKIIRKRPKDEGNDKG